MATAWIGENSSIGLVAVNVSVSACLARYTVKLDGVLVNRRLVVKNLTSAGGASLTAWSAGSAVLEIAAPSLRMHVG